MKLKLQTFTGRKMEVDLGDDPDVERTIDLTRDMIEEQFGIPAYRIVLMFEGEKLLQLDALLEDYNVDDGDLLWVIVDTRAKKPRRKKKRGKKGEAISSQLPAVPIGVGDPTKGTHCRSSDKFGEPRCDPESSSALGGEFPTIKKLHDLQRKPAHPVYA